MSCHDKYKSFKVYLSLHTCLYEKTSGRHIKDEDADQIDTNALAAWQAGFYLNGLMLLLSLIDTERLEKLCDEDTSALFASIGELGVWLAGEVMVKADGIDVAHNPKESEGGR